MQNYFKACDYMAIFRLFSKPALKLKTLKTGKTAFNVFNISKYLCINFYIIYS